eukprot:765863-Hanusia_phi.AAC.8
MQISHRRRGGGENDRCRPAGDRTERQGEDQRHEQGVRIAAPLARPGGSEGLELQPRGCGQGDDELLHVRASSLPAVLSPALQLPSEQRLADAPRSRAPGLLCLCCLQGHSVVIKMVQEGELRSGSLRHDPSRRLRGGRCALVAAGDGCSWQRNPGVQREVLVPVPSYLLGLTARDDFSYSALLSCSPALLLSPLSSCLQGSFMLCRRTSEDGVTAVNCPPPYPHLCADLS